MLTLPRRGSYTGRLAFDSDSGFHLDEKGRRVVTLDEGKTWRYATRADTPHNFRYERNRVTVDSTANELARLTVKHGPTEAAKLVDPHHFETQVHDDHYNLTAPALTALKLDTDEVAATVTSHTEAYA